MAGLQLTFNKTLLKILEPTSLAERLIGAFFIAAAWWKVEGILSGNDWDIVSASAYWIREGWMPEWYQSLLTPLLQIGGYLDLGLIVAAGQGIAGVLILLGRYVRFAGIVLFVIQLNIFFGTFNKLVFNEFVGISLWAAFYFIVKPGNQRPWQIRVWTLLTAILVFLYLLQVVGMFERQMHLPEQAEIQRLHFSADVMSLAYPIKKLTLAVTDGAFGKALWVFPTWAQLMLVFLFLTRFRLYAGMIALCIAFSREWVWMNSVTSYGVHWTLVLLLWCAKEQELRTTHPLPSLVQSFYNELKIASILSFLNQQFRRLR